MPKHPSWITLQGTLEQGHQVASGKAEQGPYPDSTIAMQQPFFKALGLDLSGLHNATLNVAIAPYQFTLHTPSHHFPLVEWTALHPPETFSFSPARVVFQDIPYDGWLYYPHPETKKTHFQNPSLVELIMPWIPDLQYGDAITVMLDANEVSVAPL